MRNSVISSSVSTVVAIANDCLVAAGVAVRTLLHHTSMRDERSGWRQPNVVHGAGFLSKALTPWSSLKRLEQHGFALCPAYAVIARPDYAAIAVAQRV